MKRLLGLAFGLALAFTMSACGAATGPVGTWGNGYNTDKQAYLELSLGAEQKGDTAGFLTGSDGCNRIVGQWALQSGELTFPKLNATELACDGVDTWLAKATGGSLDGNTLTLTNEQGAKIGTLQRRG